MLTLIIINNNNYMLFDWLFSELVVTIVPMYIKMI
jgi:hypothetical protein